MFFILGVVFINWYVFPILKMNQMLKTIKAIFWRMNA